MCRCLLQTGCALAPAPPALAGTSPRFGGVLPQIPAVAGAGSVPGSRRERGAAVAGVCLAGAGFALVQLRFSPAPPAPGLSVSDGDQRDLLLAMKTAPFPCEPAVPSAPTAPHPKDAARLQGTPIRGARERGGGDTGRAGLIPLGTGGKGRFGGGGGLVMDFRIIFPSSSPTLFQK